MKKTLIIISLLTLISCTHQDQKTRLDFSFDGKKSNIGSDTKIDLTVFDERLENGFIGTKEFCDGKKITIGSEQNLAELLKKKINAEFYKKGFKQGSDKLVEIHIQNLKYKAECGFLLGKSSANFQIKVLVTNNKTGSKATKNFELSLNNKHFILPLESTDDDTINDLIEEVIGDFLEDDILLRN